MNSENLQDVVDALKAALASGDLTLSRIDGAGGVMVHAPKELLVTLNETSCSIVEHVQNTDGADTSTIVRAITGQFEVDPDTAARDLQEFLLQLRTEVLDAAA